MSFLFNVLSQEPGTQLQETKKNLNKGNNQNICETQTNQIE